ncbi:MAG TPA: GPW/gp25 family protein [Blastocatellia bacterium]
MGTVPTIQGSWLSWPISADKTGSLAATADIHQIVAESIRAILETRQGERVMIPDYGIPDYVFDVIDIGFCGRIAFHIQQQLVNYEPLVTNVEAAAGLLVGGAFVAGISLTNEAAAVSVTYSIRGVAGPNNLVFPMWELAPGN